MGADNIGPKLLKHCALAIYVPLHHLFNLSLSQHVIPTEWKCLAISPINQFGFVKHRSSVQQILLFMNNILTYLDNPHILTCGYDIS